MVSTFTILIYQSFVFPVLAAAAAAAAWYTIRSKIKVQPSRLSTHSLCCAEHSCSMAWPSSIPEPSPKLAPRQQMKSSPSAGIPWTLRIQAVLSKEGCSRGPLIVEAVLLVTTLSFYLLFSPLLCAVRSWYAGCCWATRRLRVCYVPPLPLYYIRFRMELFASEILWRTGWEMGSSYPPSSGRAKKKC